MIDFAPALANGLPDLVSRSEPPAKWRCKVCGHVQEYRQAGPGHPPKMALVVSSPNDYTLRGYILPLSIVQDMIRRGHADLGVIYRITGGQHYRVVQVGMKQVLEEVEWTKRD